MKTLMVLVLLGSVCCGCRDGANSGRWIERDEPDGSPAVQQYRRLEQGFAESHERGRQ